MKSSVLNLDDSVQLSCFSEPILILQNIKSNLVKSNINCINEHVLPCQKLETWSPLVIVTMSSSESPGKKYFLPSATDMASHGVNYKLQCEVKYILTQSGKRKGKNE